MTKSTITREQAQKIIVAADEVITALAGTNEDVHPDDSKKMCELWDDLNDRHAPPVVVRELARMALAAMDSEPVAWTWHYREQWHVTNDSRRAEFVAKDGDVAVLPLYRHAHPAPLVSEVSPLVSEQPAPIVQPMMFIDGDISSEDADKLAKVIRDFNEEDERPLAKMARIIRENPHPTNECDMPKAQPAPVVYSDFESFWSSYIHPLAQDDELKGFAWDIWCAAMLQENAKSAGVSNNCRSSENVQVMQDHQIRELVNQLRDIAVKYHAAGQLREQIARVIRAAMLQAGNSPVIPDGWTGNDKANAALMMLDRIETVDPVDDDRIDGIKCIVRELASATQPQNAPRNIPEIISGWIPVSEQMPEDDDFVYIWPRPDFGVELHVGQYCERSHKGGGWYAQVYEQNYGIEWHPITVTHWMPLPAAPQEVKSES